MRWRASARTRSPDLAASSWPIRADRFSFLRSTARARATPRSSASASRCRLCRRPSMNSCRRSKARRRSRRSPNTCSARHRAFDEIRRLCIAGHGRPGFANAGHRPALCRSAAHRFQQACAGRRCARQSGQALFRHRSGRSCARRDCSLAPRRGAGNRCARERACSGHEARCACVRRLRRRALQSRRKRRAERRGDRTVAAADVSR